VNHVAGIKPNFFIVGVSKAGTTSLHEYLAQHPDIFMSPFKEPNLSFWFDNPTVAKPFSNHVAIH